MSKRRGLGKGLGSLIPMGEEEAPEGGLIHVPIETISPNPHQPRGSLDEVKLRELADSIAEHGVIQPLVVTKESDDRYVLIAGERRWRAAQIARLSKVPVVVKEATPQSMLELALIENIQRDDLNPLEEAYAYQQLMTEFGLIQEEVAQRVGKSRPTVANILRLLKLPENIQTAVIEEKISGAHARALLPLPTREAQTAVMNTIVKQDLSVRQVEAIVKKMLAGEKPRPKPAPRSLPAELADLESQFRQTLGTRVDIRHGSKGGKVIIHYYSDEELQAIYDAIAGDS